MNKDKKMTVREMVEKIRENNARIREIAEKFNSEEREANEEELAELSKIKRENQYLNACFDAVNGPAAENVDKRSIDQKFRETLAELNGSKTAVTITLQRDIQTTAALAGTGIIPVHEQEMLKPLREALIWNLIGVKVPTGKNLRWPKHGKATAAFAGEGDALTPQSISWDKVESVTKRLGVAIDVTRQELEDSEGIVEGVIREEMPAAIVDKINDALFATSTTSRVIYGPFAKAGATGGCAKVSFAAALPTRAEILKMKSTIAKAHVKPQNCVWVMTETLKAQLEDVKVDAGSGRFLVENDRMLGYPIYTTDAIGDLNIGFGDWSYQACGLGNPSIIFDPYSLALNDASRFVDNSDTTFATLRPEAFVLGVCKTA